jgi:hypothetical protein
MRLEPTDLPEVAEDRENARFDNLLLRSSLILDCFVRDVIAKVETRAPDFR